MPIRFAPAVMSLLGLALAWRTLSESSQALSTVAQVVSIGAVLIGLVTLGSIVYHLSNRAALKETLQSPVLRILLACLTVGLMLLSALLAPHTPMIGSGLIWFAAGAHLTLLAWLLNGWLSGNTPIEQITPVWFIPTVGNIVIPIGAMASGHLYLAWFGFSVGLMLWLALLPLVIYRLMHASPLPPETEAVQMVMVAPPAIGSVAWFVLAGDTLLIPGVILLSFAGFLGLTLVPMILRVLNRPFSPANWSFGFPLAALSSGLMLYADAIGSLWLGYVGVCVLLFVSVIVLWLLLGSARVLIHS